MIRPGQRWFTPASTGPGEPSNHDGSNRNRGENVVAQRCADVAVQQLMGSTGNTAARAPQAGGCVKDATRKSASRCRWVADCNGDSTCSKANATRNRCRSLPGLCNSHASMVPRRLVTGRSAATLDQRVTGTGALRRSWWSADHRRRSVYHHAPRQGWPGRPQRCW